MATPTTTRNLNGSLTVSTIEYGRLIQQTYYGYSKREAVRLFREHVRNES